MYLLWIHSYSSQCYILVYHNEIVVDNVVIYGQLQTPIIEYQWDIVRLDKLMMSSINLYLLISNFIRRYKNTSYKYSYDYKIWL